MEQIKQYGLRRIKEEIPRFILNSVFLKPDYDLGNNRQFMTLDASICSSIIDSSILLDLTLIDGSEQQISLEGLEPNYNIDGTMVINIPFERTGGKEIIEIYRINFTPYTYAGYSNSQGQTDTDRKVEAVQMAVQSIPVTSTTDCTIIAPNTILADVGSVRPFLMTAEVNLAISNNLGHVPPKAFELFGDLCVARAQQYIYIESIINMNRGFIDRGQELGIYQDMITGYSDAHQNYRDLLRKWRKFATFMDHNKMSKYLKMITPSIM